MSKSNIKVVRISPSAPRVDSKTSGFSNLVSIPKDIMREQSEVRLDGWQNLITSLGTNNDKRKGSNVFWDYRSPEFFEQAYAGDYLMSRIVNLIPEHSLKKWVEWQGVEKPIAKEIEKRNKALDLRGAIERTWKWGRAYGGACTYIVTDTNDPASTLRIGEHVIGLRDLSRYDLRILTTDIETDFGSPNWGHPNIYYLVVQVGSEFKGYPIHWTRMVRFDGYLVPRRTFIRNNYWHDSVLNRVYSVVQDYQTAYDSMSSIMSDFNVGVYKMKNLANLMQAGKEAKVKQRIELLNYSKSVIRAMVLDPEDEEFEDMSRSVEGLAELLGKMDNRLVAATDIPHTVLLGESPDGSNATGNSTMHQWFDHLSSEQENYLRPKMKRITDALYYDMPDLDFKFKQLYQKTEAEDADIRLKTAQADQIYLEHNVVDPTEIADSRFGGDQYSMDTKLDIEGREMGLINPGAQEGMLEGEEDDNTEPPEGKKKNPFEKADGDEGAFPMEEQAQGNAAMNELGKKSMAKGGQAESESETASLPESLQPFVPNPNAVESQNPGVLFAPRNEKIVGPEKANQLISQTMSEPMRDPKFDPILRTGGQPNKPRKIIPSRGNGVIAPSGGSEPRADQGESAIMPRGLDHVKSGRVSPPQRKGDAEKCDACGFLDGSHAAFCSES